MTEREEPAEAGSRRRVVRRSRLCAWRRAHSTSQPSYERSAVTCAVPPDASLTVQSIWTDAMPSLRTA